MALENQPIDEIAEFLKDSEKRSNNLFNNELSFVTDWDDEEGLYC